MYTILFYIKYPLWETGRMFLLLNFIYCHLMKTTRHWIRIEIVIDRAILDCWLDLKTNTRSIGRHWYIQSGKILVAKSWMWSTKNRFPFNADFPKFFWSEIKTFGFLKKPRKERERKSKIYRECSLSTSSVTMAYLSMFSF